MYTRSIRLLITLVAGLVATVSLAHVARAETVRFDGPDGAPRISLIGDSTLAGVRWYADYGSLRRFDFVFDAESCRRTIDTSCFSQEGFRSENVLATMQTLAGELGEVLVVKTGHNDPIGSIDAAIAAVVDEARRQGVGHVVWLTLRTSPDVDYSDPQEQSGIETFRRYNEALATAAAESDGYLQIADWATYSFGASGWFEYDGVHLTPAGVDALTTYVTGIVEQVLAGTDVSPAEAPWTVLVPGATGDVVVDVQNALVDAGIELRGGVDGEYGGATMVAVAEYQRSVDGLFETGAVDLATARSLGVLDEPPADAGPPVDEPASPPAEASAVLPVAEPATSEAISADAPGGRGSNRVLVVAGVIVVALALAVAARRRQVVVRRRRIATRRRSDDRVPVASAERHPPFTSDH